MENHVLPWACNRKSIYIYTMCNTINVHQGFPFTLQGKQKGAHYFVLNKFTIHYNRAFANACITLFAGNCLFTFPNILSYSGKF